MQILLSPDLCPVFPIIQYHYSRTFALTSFLGLLTTKVSMVSIKKSYDGFFSKFWNIEVRFLLQALLNNVDLSVNGKNLHYLWMFKWRAKKFPQLDSWRTISQNFEKFTFLHQTSHSFCHNLLSGCIDIC